MRVSSTMSCRPVTNVSRVVSRSVCVVVLRRPSLPSDRPMTSIAGDCATLVGLSDAGLVAVVVPAASAESARWKLLLAVSRLLLVDELGSRT